MASSKKLPSDLVSHVEQVLASRIASGQHLRLGLSGGLDSVVLLKLLLPLRTTLGFRLSAVHVNHQISPHAEEWGAFCGKLCDEEGIPFQLARVNLPRNTGESLEALARQARYRVLLKDGADFVVLAHHLDDQVETMVLQLLRGAGVEGARAMAEEEGRLLRPLLGLRRSALEIYARSQGLAWVDDESNRNTRFDRNFLRHEVFPLLGQRFPAYRDTLGRAAHHFAESALLQEDLARLDASSAIKGSRLSVHALESLRFHRAKNLLRYFLRLNGVGMPSTTRLEQLLHQILVAKRDAQLAVTVGAHQVRRYRDQVWVIDVPEPHSNMGGRVPWRGEDALQLPGHGGGLRFCRVEGQGISLARLLQGQVTVGIREGGERLRPDCQRPRRSLKHLFQEAGVPPWVRYELPLLFCDEELVAVVGLGVDCAFQARDGEPGIMLEWEMSRT